MEWFEEWFDSPLYEKLYANRDEAEAARLGRLLMQLIPASKYPRILDLGCGRGRHSLFLARHAYEVTGIDLSSAALKTARAKAENLGLQNIQFKQRDMRKSRDEEFDAIINLFTTFGYFKTDAENERVLDVQKSMLRTGGKIVIDFMNAAKVRRNIEPVSEGQIDHYNYRIERSIEGDVIRKEIEFYDEESRSKKEYIERVKLYEPEWFVQELKKRDFSIEGTMGDYTGSAFEKEKSDRFIIVANKQ